MTWVQRLKRVFGIDIETFPACGGAVRIIALKRLMSSRRSSATWMRKRLSAKPPKRPLCRAPPERGLFDETG
jgi:hypothetical protein